MKLNESDKRVCTQNPLADAIQGALPRFDRHAVNNLLNSIKKRVYLSIIDCLNYIRIFKINFAICSPVLKCIYLFNKG